MRIHKMDHTTEWGWEYDEKNGPARKEIRKYKVSAADSISHQGHTYKVSDDGSFDVPDDLGEFLLNTPDWYPGLPPMPPQDKPEPPRRGRPRKEA